MDTQQIKQRFGIIGNHPALNRALDIAYQVAPTDLSVLITGESGVGKEVFPQVIHQNSPRKHNAYFAVNCGAIPEGTIDSELFGHEKGSFTSAHDARKGYFEVADGGTLFLDEVAELPLSTQVRLLRVLETGEFLKVGSSRTQKTDVRIIAATNVNLPRAIQQGKFREDLYYRLNTVPIVIPPLRDRTEDIYLLFRKFSADFAEKYKMPPITLTSEAKEQLAHYSFPGNIRQLKNITEQMSIIETEREIGVDKLLNYLPAGQNLPALYHAGAAEGAGASMVSSSEFATERDILYKILFDMRSDVNELKQLVNSLMNAEAGVLAGAGRAAAARQGIRVSPGGAKPVFVPQGHDDAVVDVNDETETLSLNEHELGMIKKALEKHQNKRKNAARELGISERTLYRKIKDYGLE